MTVAEILNNEDLRREEFPVACSKAFLAHAGVCPLPRRVAEAVAHAALNSAADDQEAVIGLDHLRTTRALAAKLIHAQPEEIALVAPTSLGLSMVANGLKFRRTDHVLVYHDDFPANVHPWMALANRGVEVRFLNVKELGRIRARDVTGQVDECTRLVALASCHFVAGWRVDLAAVGKYLRERKILFCVDGIQTLGAFPTTVEHVDFLAADAHKWLLGPLASGILYVRKELQDKLAPTVFGWHNIRCPDYIAADELVFRSDARRYEAGSANLLGLAGLRAALELIHELGVENIAAELMRKRAWLVPALLAKGWNVLQADAPPESASAILALWRDDADLPALHQRLADHQIVTSLRRDRSGRRYLRLSPHFYNTDAELRRALELL
ncbi:MAG: aminotransferase class V-fold PLP-dependent enzyme [Verrucomicrobia bacterium]|nr:aminotransferase class V-fold PLP-dependent enzyme [Verrucomicrobiota bacterium]